MHVVIGIFKWRETKNFLCWTRHTKYTYIYRNRTICSHDWRLQKAYAVWARQSFYISIQTIKSMQQVENMYRVILESLSKSRKTECSEALRLHILSSVSFCRLCWRSRSMGQYASKPACAERFINRVACFSNSKYS